MRGEGTNLSVAPATVESSETVVTFDCFVTPVTLPGHVTLHLNMSDNRKTTTDCYYVLAGGTHPVMCHLLISLHCLHIGADTGGRGALDTPLVHRVLTN